jgi:dTDP-4-dehydrorhamnose reductase
MQPKRILVTGKNGQLGQSLINIVSQRSSTIDHRLSFDFVGRDELDLANPESVERFFVDNRFDAIINCAAYTAVDKAESEPGLADQINHLAVKQLAEIAKQQDATLIHISTDYVFNGQNYKPYIESDETDPQSVYGTTKLKGEQAFLEVNPKGCIIRTSWVYSEYGNNFVKTMLRLGKEKDQLSIIFDQVGTPTYAGDLAEVILQIIDRAVIARSASDVAIYESSRGLKMDRHAMLAMTEGDVPTEKSEIFHFSNEGVCSWYDFAKAIFGYAKIPCVVLPIETKNYPTPATRPHYSLLNKAKIKQAFNLSIPYWKDSLQTCIKRLQEQN